MGAVLLSRNKGWRDGSEKEIKKRDFRLRDWYIGTVEQQLNSIDADLSIIIL